MIDGVLNKRKKNGPCRNRRHQPPHHPKKVSEHKLFDCLQKDSSIHLNQSCRS